MYTNNNDDLLYPLENYGAYAVSCLFVFNDNVSFIGYTGFHVFQTIVPSLRSTK